MCMRKREREREQSLPSGIGIWNPSDHWLYLNLPLIVGDYIIGAAKLCNNCWYFYICMGDATKYLFNVGLFLSSLSLSPSLSLSKSFTFSPLAAYLWTFWSMLFYLIYFLHCRFMAYGQSYIVLYGLNFSLITGEYRDQYRFLCLIER